MWERCELCGSDVSWPYAAVCLRLFSFSHLFAFNSRHVDVLVNIDSQGNENELCQGSIQLIHIAPSLSLFLSLSSSLSLSLPLSLSVSLSPFHSLSLSICLSLVPYCILYSKQRPFKDLCLCSCLTACLMPYTHSSKIKSIDFPSLTR